MRVGSRPVGQRMCGYRERYSCKDVLGLARKGLECQAKGITFILGAVEGH